MTDYDWMAEAKKSGLTPAEASADDLVQAQRSAHEGFKSVLDAVREALGEVRRRCD